MQLKTLYKNIKFNSKEIPLWMIYLRFLSSKQVLSFEPTSTSKLYNIINTAITDTIKKSDESTNIKSFDWINLLLAKPPHKIENQKIKMIHDFLVNLIDDKLFDENEHIYECIYNTISELTQKILTNKLNMLLDDRLDSESINFSFVIHQII